MKIKMLKGKFSVEVRQDEISEKIGLQLKEFLLSSHLTEDVENPDYVFAIGGDGTVLRTFNKYMDKLDTVKFLSIHTGHLGFYTDYSVQNYEKIFFDMLALTPKIEEYPLLRVKAYCSNGDLVSDYYSLNEVTVNNHTGVTYAAKVYINGVHFESFRGDGLCISTPTGSTAYNKSLGGAVIHPQLPLYQVTEIAALNNLVYRTLGNPLILSQDDELMIKPIKPENHRITVDHMHYNYDSVAKIKITLSKEKKVSFIRYNEESFWQRVKRSFIKND